MLVIFLDFDGLLNNHKWFMKNNNFMYQKVSLTNEFDPENVANFNSILEAVPQAKIVLSTSWRNSFPWGELMGLMEAIGIDTKKIVGKTPEKLTSNRGQEIRMFLNDWEGEIIDNYVILDDDALWDSDFDDNFVRTSEMIGLTKAKAKKAIEILKRQ